MSDSKWFSQAGNLDDSSDSSNTRESAPISRETDKPHTDSSSSATFIKPVKGLSDRPAAAPVRRETKPVTPVVSETRPVKPVVERVSERTAPSNPIPRYYPEEKKASVAASSSVSSNAKFSVKNILRILALICSILVFMPSFLVSCSGHTFNVTTLDAAKGAEIGGQRFNSNPVLFICILVPIAIFVLLFIKMLGKTKGIIISSITAVDLLIWFRFFSQVKDKATQLNCSFKPTIWFVINILCLFGILVLSILTIVHVFEIDTDDPTKKT